MNRLGGIAKFVSAGLFVVGTLAVLRGIVSEGAERWVLWGVLAWTAGNSFLLLATNRSSANRSRSNAHKLRSSLVELRSRLDEGLAAVDHGQRDLARRAGEMTASCEQLGAKLESAQGEEATMSAQILDALAASRDEVLQGLKQTNKTAVKYTRNLKRVGSRHLQRATDRVRDLLDVELVALRSIEELEQGDAEDPAGLIERVRRRNVMAAQNIEFRNALEDSRIREIYLAELFEGIEELSVPLGVIREDAGHPNQAEQAFVVAIAKHRRCRRILEIGTHLGRTTYHLAQATPDTEVFTVDLPDADGKLKDHIGNYFAGSDVAERITQVACDSRELDTTPYAGRMDMVLVDGDHSYELVANDTVKAFEALAPGGVILWHDYAPKCPGVVQFARELAEDKPLFRLRKTSVLVYIDGVDPFDFEPRPTKVPLKSRRRPDVLLLP